MAALSTSTKAKAGTKAAKTAVKNPGLVKVTGKSAKPVAKLGLKGGKPVAKRRVKNRFETIGGALRSAADELVTYGPSAAQELGLVETPKPKRTAPRVLAGVVIGAGAMYAVEHREKVANLVS
jgi:hypothetical protein